MMLKSKLYSDQRGGSSVTISMMIIAILMVMALSFARIISIAKAETEDHSFNRTATYAAEAGINDARKHIFNLYEAKKRDPSTDWSMPFEGLDGECHAPNELLGTSGVLQADEDGDASIRYTCVSINSTPDLLQYDKIENDKSLNAYLNTARIEEQLNQYPRRAYVQAGNELDKKDEVDSAPDNFGYLDRLEIEWKNYDDKTIVYPEYNADFKPKFPAVNAWHNADNHAYSASVLKVQIVAIQRLNDNPSATPSCSVANLSTAETCLDGGGIWGVHPYCSDSSHATADACRTASATWYTPRHINTREEISDPENNKVFYLYPTAPGTNYQNEYRGLSWIDDMENGKIPLVGQVGANLEKSDQYRVYAKDTGYNLSGNNVIKKRNSLRDGFIYPVHCQQTCKVSVYDLASFYSSQYNPRNAGITDNSALELNPRQAVKFFVKITPLYAPTSVRLRGFEGGDSRRLKIENPADSATTIDSKKWPSMNPEAGPAASNCNSGSETPDSSGNVDGWCRLIFLHVQSAVRATGHALDIRVRLEEVIPLRFKYRFPEYAIQTSETLCKTLINDKDSGTISQDPSISVAPGSNSDICEVF